MQTLWTTCFILQSLLEENSVSNSRRFRIFQKLAHLKFSNLFLFCNCYLDIKLIELGTLKETLSTLPILLVIAMSQTEMNKVTQKKIKKVAKFADFEGTFTRFFCWSV